MHPQYLRKHLEFVFLLKYIVGLPDSLGTHIALKEETSHRSTYATIKCIRKRDSRLIATLNSYASTLHKKITKPRKLLQCRVSTLGDKILSNCHQVISLDKCDALQLYTSCAIAHAVLTTRFKWLK